MASKRTARRLRAERPSSGTVRITLRLTPEGLTDVREQLDALEEQVLADLWREWGLRITGTGNVSKPPNGSAPGIVLQRTPGLQAERGS